MLLFLLVVLGAESFSVQVGQIWVEAPVNATILLDGRVAGVVAPRVGGLMMTNVSVGQHTVVVRASGGVVSRVVEVRALETYQLVVPALSLHQRSVSDIGDLQVKSVSRRCTVMIAGSRHEMTSKTLTVKNLAPGPYDLTVLCGPTEMKGRIAIRKDHTTLVEADARGPIVRVVGEQPRPRRGLAPPARADVTVETVPREWKRAIATVLDSAIYEFSIQNVTGTTITATYRCSSAKVAAVLNEKLYSRPEVEDLTLIGTESVTGGVLVRVKITFVP